MSESPRSLVLSVATLQTVWASRYGALKRCLLRETALVGGQEPLMPQSPRSYLGTAIHKLLERAAGDASFPFSESGLTTEWEKAIAEIEARLSDSPFMEGMLPLSQSIPNIGLMRARTLLRILEAGPPAPPTAPAETKPKRFPGRLSNLNGSVIGIPDRIEFREAGVAIVDFKTGMTGEAAGPFWGDYQLQLKLYAALYHVASGRWPSKLELQGLDGSVHDVAFAPEECSALMKEAEEFAKNLQNATSQLSSGEAAQIGTASPSGTNCRYCSFRPKCAAYVQIAFSEEPPCECDVVGTVNGWRTFGNGEYLLEMERGGVQMRVRNLPPIGHIRTTVNSAVSGTRVIVFNVSRRGEGEPLFSPSAFTAVHAYSDNN